MVLIGAVFLVACSSAADTPASAVETYIRTRITGDAPKLVTLACKARESDARQEADSFAAQKATIESVSCQTSGAEAEFTVVACIGKMVTTYAGETRDFDLSARKFKTIQEDGRWKVCGYTR
ncbi:MAG: hypothetical protein OHK0023_21750 [Anaerolineae bacterium]